MDAGCRMSPLKVVEAWHASQRLDRGPLTKTRPHARAASSCHNSLDTKKVIHLVS
jgi:hypothetical protein